LANETGLRCNVIGQSLPVLQSTEPVNVVNITAGVETAGGKWMTAVATVAIMESQSTLIHFYSVP